MNETVYRGYIIEETDDGYFQVEDIEFPTYDEALDWIDSMFTESEPSIVYHVYRFSYVDEITYLSYNVEIEASNYEEAEQILENNYCVHHIIRCDIVG